MYASNNIFYQFYEFSSGISSEILTIIGAAILILGVLDCFFGYKIQKIIAVFQTLVIMLIISLFVVALNFASGSDLSSGIIFLVMLLLTIIICYFVYRFFGFGVFISVFLTVTLLGGIIGEVTEEAFILSAILGFIIGILAFKFYRIAIIVLTSVRGGILCSFGIPMLAEEIPELSFVFIGTFIFALVGFFVQSKMNKKANKKQNSNNPLYDISIQETVQTKDSENISNEYITEYKNNMYNDNIQLNQEKQIDKNKNLGGIICNIFSEENGKKIIEKLTYYSQFLMLIMLVISIFQFFDNNTLIIDFQPYAIALAILAAKNKKYIMTTISFSIWSLFSLIDWISFMDYYRVSLIYFFTTFLYCCIALFAGVACNKKR